MLSRVANSLYWMGRYLERANNVARFIDVNLRLILDMHLERQKGHWEPLVMASGGHDDFIKRYGDFNEQNVVAFLTFDSKNPNSIISCVETARENARVIREMISSDLWKCINSFYHLVKKNSRKRRIENLQPFYMEITNFGNLISGLQQDSISHGEAWHFMRMGEMLERADNTARLLDVKYFLLLPNNEEVNSPHDIVEWGAVLLSASAFEMYHKKFHRVNYHDVAKFLILDCNFPRSMMFCINDVKQSLNNIIKILEINVPASIEIKKLHNILTAKDISSILKDGLHEFIDYFQLNLNKVDEAIYNSFFAIKLNPTNQHQSLEGGLLLQQ